jgi:S-adenosyl-L-methionine hydrolase (adenosine-forming)
MPIITLISDWGPKDHYTGAVKGAILRQDPSIPVVDITHQVSPFNILQASFVLRNSYKEFPDGTIHIIGVNTDESEQHPHIAVFNQGHYFIGADNGIFSLAFDGLPEKIIEIEVPQDSDYFTFSTRDRFVKAACHLASGKPIEELGFVRTQLTEKHHFKPVVEPSRILGKVIYIDGYENIFVNITREVFDKNRKQRAFEIQVRQSEYQIRKIHTSYSDVDSGDIVALFGSTGFLEIAINQGNAASLLGIGVDDYIRIEFMEK